MSVPVYKELDKTATDLITKGFPVDTHGFEVEGSAASGIKFKATGTQQADNTVDALFETSKACPEHGVTAKLSTKTEKKKPVYCGEVTYEPKPVVGLKVTATGECSGSDDKQSETYKLAVLYKRADKATSETTVSYHGAVEASSSLSVAHQSFRAGANATYSFASGEKAAALKQYGFKFGFYPKNLALTAVWATTGANSTVGANFWHKNEKCNAEVSGDVSLNPHQLGESPVFRFAVQHTKDASTFKARFTSKGNVALSLKQQLTDSVAVTVASECSVQGSAQKNGVSLNLKL